MGPDLGMEAEWVPIIPFPSFFLPLSTERLWGDIARK